MAQVIFYEKPGCINNTKQKSWLAAAGHNITAKDILQTQWTTSELQLYFGDRPVSDWFNTTAPKVKSGEISPAAFRPEDALELMVKEPLLIKRPLIRVDDRRMQGFDKDVIHEWIGLLPSEGNEAIVEKLSKDNLTVCPKLNEPASCEDQPSAIPEKPLSLIMEITDAVGLEVTHEYDDLVFVSHNVLIYQFTPIGKEVDLFFNKDCEPTTEKRLTQTLRSAAKAKGINLTTRGHYILSEADSENISIEFIQTA